MGLIAGLRAVLGIDGATRAGREADRAHGEADRSEHEANRAEAARRSLGDAIAGWEAQRATVRGHLRAAGSAPFDRPARREG